MFGKTVEYEFAVGGMSCGHCEAVWSGRCAE